MHTRETNPTNEFVAVFQVVPGRGPTWIVVCHRTQVVQWSVETARFSLPRANEGAERNYGVYVFRFVVFYRNGPWAKQI